MKKKKSKFEPGSLVPLFLAFTQYFSPNSPSEPGFRLKVALILFSENKSRLKLICTPFGPRGRRGRRRRRRRIPGFSGSWFVEGCPADRLASLRGAQPTGLRSVAFELFSCRAVFFVIFVSSLRSKLLAPQHRRRGRPPSSFVAMRNARRRDGPRPHKIIEVVPSFDGEPTAAGAPPKRPHATPPVEPEEEPALAVFDAEAAAVDAAAVSSDEDEPTAVDGETVDDEPTAVGRVRLPVASECEAHPRKAALSPSTPSTKDAEVARRVVEVVGASQSKDVASIGLFEGSLDVEMAPKEDLHILSRPAGYEEEFMVKRAWNLMSTSEQYNYAYNKIRGFYVKYVHALRLDSEEEREAFLAMPARQRQAEGRVAFSNLEKDVRDHYMRQWLDVARPPSWLQFFCKQRMTAGEVSGPRSKQRGVLLTWQLPGSGPSASGILAESLPPCAGSLEEVVSRLRNDSTAQSLWGHIVMHGEGCRRRSGAEDVAVCLEICPETYSLQNALRLHVHMFLKHSSRGLRLHDCSVLTFEGVKCHMASQIGGVAAGQGRNSWCVFFFYCCVLQKKGAVFSMATKEPFCKFAVSPTWIMTMIQAGKLSVRAGRELLVQCVSASRHLRELDQYEMELEKAAVVVAKRTAEDLVGRTFKKQKSYDEVDAFVNQFAEGLARYKFLVLAGPSKVGKTAFARSLCEDGLEVLEVNCASGVEPNLRAYRLRLHGLILFDEIVAKQVAEQRELFQAQNAPVQLGCSATNCHSYDVFVWRKSWCWRPATGTPRSRS